VSGGGDQRHPWTGRGWKGAEPPLVIGGGDQRHPWAGRAGRGRGPLWYLGRGVKIHLGHMFLHHTDSFHIAYLHTTVLFNGSNGTAYTRPSRVRNNNKYMCCKRIVMKESS
jgi:hypothetical protein